MAPRRRLVPVLLLALLLPAAAGWGVEPAVIEEVVLAPPPSPPPPLAGGEAVTLSSPPPPAAPSPAPPAALKLPTPRLTLDFLQSECSPLAAADKGFFASVWRGEDPLVATCLDEVARFLDNGASAAEASEALQLQASLLRRRKDFPREAVTLGRLLALADSSSGRDTAQARLRQLAANELKPASAALDALAESAVRGSTPQERGLQLLQGLARIEERSLFGPVREEIERFLRAFPLDAAAESALALRADNFGRDRQFARQSFDLRRLVRLYPASSERPQRLLALGDLCARELRQYAAALAAWDELLALYPAAPECPAALQRSATVLAEELQRHAEAQERLGRIVAQWPRTAAASQALSSLAALQTRLGKEREAIATWQELAAMFPASESGLQARIAAAELAGRLRDYSLQVTLLAEVSREYPGREESWQAEFTRAQLLEEKLGQRAAALAGYEALVGAASGHRLAVQAQRRIDRLRTAAGG